MAGYYHKNESKYLEILNSWKSNLIINDLWDNYIDIHIDEIEKNIDQEEWLDFSLYILELTKNQIETSNYVILLVIPLSYLNYNLLVSSIDKTFISNNLDITPPSFYLFQQNNTNFLTTINSCIQSKNLSKELNKNCFIRIENDNNECSIVIYIMNTFEATYEVCEK